MLLKKDMGDAIEATILNGKFRGDNVLLPHIPLVLTKTLLQFKRL